MKKYIKALVFATVVLSTTSCKDFLNELPDSRVEPQNAEDYQAMLVNAYPQANYLFTEWMTDNFKYYDYPSFNNPTLVSWVKPIYMWSDGYQQNLPIGPEKAWREYYTDINTTNVVLEGIDEIADSPLKRSVMGETYLVRAYCHFMLVNLFAKHYDPATATTDLGIPIKNEVGDATQENFPRNTVAEVYDFIEQDIAKGIELINDDKVPSGDARKYHFTKATAYAFLSRVKLFKQDWNACIDASAKALNLNSSIRDIVSDYNKFIPVKSDLAGFKRDYASAKKDNILLLSQSVDYNSSVVSGYYANDFKNLYLADDYRGKLFYFTTNTTPNWVMLKFIASGYSSNIVEFSVEEILLNQAEAYTKSSSPNYNGAVNNLNKILAKRYSPFTALNLSDFENTGNLQQSLADRIITERRLEFAYEGMRWFDIRRLKLSVSHTTENGTDVLKSGDLRYELQIPVREAQINKDIQLNPR